MALKQNKLDKLNLILFFNDLPEKKENIGWIWMLNIYLFAQVRHPTPPPLHPHHPLLRRFVLLAPQITLVQTERENVFARKEAHNR